MDSLDRIYSRLLQSGLIAIRDAAEAGDLPRCTAEADHIHNIPSLIGEHNLHRHVYYATKERKAYLDWVLSVGRKELREYVSLVYEPEWEQMDKILGLR